MNEEETSEDTMKFSLSISPLQQKNRNTKKKFCSQKLRTQLCGFCPQLGRSILTVLKGSKIIEMGLWESDVKRKQKIVNSLFYLLI